MSRELDAGRFLERAGTAIAGATLAIALLAMSAQVISRYALGNSIIWAEEFARYALIWSAMIGSSVAYRQGAHIAMTVLTDALPDAVRGSVFRVVHLIALVFSIVLAWQGWSLMARNFERDQLSPAMQIEIGWAYLAVPVGAVFIALAALEALWKGKDIPSIAGEAGQTAWRS